MTETMTYTAARADLASTIDRVVNDRVPIVTRKKNESVVMMSLSDYEAWAETVHLLRNPRNAKRLIASISSLENQDAIEKDLETLGNG